MVGTCRQRGVRQVNCYGSEFEIDGICCVVYIVYCAGIMASRRSIRCGIAYDQLDCSRGEGLYGLRVV